jgi:hypothetical protein
VNANFSVTLSAPSGKTVTVQYATSAGGDATEGTDYTAVSPTTLTFTPGDVSETATVVVQGDNIDEVDETFNVTLSNPSNASIGDGAGVGTILDDDAVTVSVNDASVAEGDTPSTVNASFVVTLSVSSSQTVTVQYATSAGGNATAGTDYTAVSLTTLTFTPGDVSETATVVVQGDDIDEVDETFNVTLSNPSNASIADGTGVGTILDDDPAPTVSWTAPSQSNPESVTAVTVTAQLSAISGRTVTVPFSVNASSTAANPGDYTISPSPLTITAGNLSASVTITVVSDAVPEPDKTVIVDIGVPVNATPGSPASHTVTIDDDL